MVPLMRHRPISGSAEFFGGIPKLPFLWLREAARIPREGAIASPKQPS
jgi:hypothetical protein